MPDVQSPHSAELERLEQAMIRLLSPQSDAVQAEMRWQQARGAVNVLQNEASGIKAVILDLGRQLTEADSKLERLNTRIGADLDSRGEELAAHFSPVDGIALDRFEEIELSRSNDLQAKINSANTRCSNTEKRLIASMKDAKQLDTGALTNTGSDLQDIPDFLERLRVLKEEVLPDKEKRFLD